MAKMTPTASAFSSDTWLRAVLAQVPSLPTVAAPRSSDPFSQLVAKRVTLPFAHMESAVTALTPCPLPITTRTPNQAEAEAYLNQLAVPLVLRGAAADHPVTAALLKAAGHVRILSSWQRAALDVSGNFETWMADNFDHKRRKELKRLKARLSEQGALTIDELTANESAAPHIAALLDVEISGWKGQRGTAIKSDGTIANGFLSGLNAMHNHGKLRFWTMRLDGQPIASLFALVEGGEAVLGKIGYDEAFAKYSPGVLLIIEATQSLFNDPTIHFADANAIPGHPMIDRIWRDRLACMDVVIAGPAVNSFTFQTVSRFHGMKDALCLRAKRIYLRLTGRKKS